MAPDELPIPPLEMRKLVGPTDPSFFELGDKHAALPYLDDEQFEAVLDFGCGCGRVARMLVQQEARPKRYVGIDLHKGMIDWCRANLQPRADGFEFVHHDVYELGFNPTATERWRPFPVEDHAFTLVNATSVFTHLLEEDAVRYLHEVARVLRDDGVLFSTWFLFDKREFPMMQPFQNVLFVNPANPINATIFDRAWLLATLDDVGLVLTRAEPPTIRGFQWTLIAAPKRPGLESVELPPDEAPYGTWEAPLLTRPANVIGTDLDT